MALRWCYLFLRSFLSLSLFGNSQYQHTWSQLVVNKFIQRWAKKNFRDLLSHLWLKIFSLCFALSLFLWFILVICYLPSWIWTTRNRIDINLSADEFSLQSQRFISYEVIENFSRSFTRKKFTVSLSDLISILILTWLLNTFSVVELYLAWFISSTALLL